MRIAFVVNSLGLGGAERHTVQLANALDARGFETGLVYLHPREDLLPLVAPRLRDRTCRIDRAGPIDLRAMRNLRRTLALLQPQVVFAVGEYPLAMVFASTWPVARPPAVVAINHSSSPDAGRWSRGQRNSALLTLADRLWRPSCQAVVLLSERQRRFWRDRGLGHRNEWLIPNGVDPERFGPPASALPHRDDGMHVVMAAVMRPEKRHDLVLRAAAALVRRGVEVRLTFVGDGAERGAIEALATTLGLRGRLQITGFTHRPEAHLAQADVVCLASDNETFSLSLLEAMSMSKAVVATDVGAASEVIVSGVNGIVVPPSDEDALVAALERMRSRPLRERIGSAARQTVLRHYTEATMVDQYAALLQTLSTGAGAPQATAAA